MDRRITLALVAVLVVLGGYIWYTFLRADAPPLNPVTPEPTPILFLDLDESKIQTVRVRNLQDNQTTQVVRDGEGWKMEQPAQGPAVLGPINSLIFALSRVDVDRKLASPGDLAGYGLNPAKYQVDLTMQDGTAITVLVGGENPDGDYSYAMKNGDAAVYLIDFSLQEQIAEFVTKPPYTPTPEPTQAPEATPTP